MNRLKDKTVVLIVGIITVLGLAVRICCCFYDYPILTHPDEPVIVDSAIDMLARHSWEANVFFRPDHFEIKCDMLIFYAVSRVLFGVSPVEAYPGHRVFFYMLARFYTAFFGAALIPLTSLLTGRLLSAAGPKERGFGRICSAAFTAVSVLMIQQSSFATPDMVQAFIFMAFTYCCCAYLDGGSDRYIYACAVLTGIGITVKYPSLVLCVPLAVMVIYRTLQKREKAVKILDHAWRSAATVFATVFIIAPNLIINNNAVIEAVAKEAEPAQLGADGLDMAGNLLYYINLMMDDLSYISVFLFFCGLLFMLMKRKNGQLSLLTGPFYLIFISILSLHWGRWAVPVFPYYIVVISAGMAGFMHFTQLADLRPTIRKLSGLIFTVLVTVMAASLTVSAVCYVRNCMLPTTQEVTYSFLEENGITRENTLYEGYTPFAPSDAYNLTGAFELTEKGIVVKEEHADRSYFMMSDSFVSRYRAEPERYIRECAIYSGIDTDFPLVYRCVSDGSWWYQADPVKNIISGVQYMLRKASCKGNTISIYDIRQADE